MDRQNAKVRGLQGGGGEREMERCEERRVNRYKDVMWALLQSGLLYSVVPGAWLICVIVDSVSLSSFLGLVQLI